MDEADLKNRTQAERRIVGGLLKDPSLIPETLGTVTPADFRDPLLALLYAAAVELYESGEVPTLTSLAEFIDSRMTKGEPFRHFPHSMLPLREPPLGTPPDQRFIHLLAELLDVWAPDWSLRVDARSVRDRGIRRRLRFACQEILQTVRDRSGDPQELLEFAEKKILDIANRQTAGGVSTAADSVRECVALYEDIAAGSHSRGLPYGFPDLDLVTTGLHPEEFVIIAARPGVGKSAMALALTHHAAVKGRVPVFVASLEMSRVELTNRLLAMHGGFDSQRLRAGRLRPSEMDSFAEAQQAVAAAPIFYDDAAGQSMLRIAANARRLRHSEGIGLVVVDYVQLVDPDDRRARRHEQVGAVSRRLKTLAKELKIPVVGLSQVNRSSDDRGGTPRLSDLKDSGSLEQDADTVILLHKEHKSRRDLEPGQTPDAPVEEVDCIVAKQRHGPTRDILLAYRKACARFENFQHGY